MMIHKKTTRLLRFRFYTPSSSFYQAVGLLLGLLDGLTHGLNLVSRWSPARSQISHMTDLRITPAHFDHQFPAMNGYIFK